MKEKKVDKEEKEVEGKKMAKATEKLALNLRLQ